MYIKSPLNYTGGKFKILNKIIPLIPKKINTFVDLFAGGFNVGININAKIIICNDIEKHVIDLLENLYKYDLEYILYKLDNLVKQYQLTKTNSEGYYKLREDYNNNKSWDKFYMLICFGFNHQIRFNKNGKFNIPFGNRTFNIKLRENFVQFIKHIKLQSIVFYNKNFTEIHIDKLKTNDYVYCDPPYLLGTASYNEFIGWNEKNEHRLLKLLDELHKNNIGFGLSNVIEHKGKTNTILTNWANKYKIYYMNSNFNNCNYQTKNKNHKTIEVFISNK